jgi:hypothetical protein
VPPVIGEERDMIVARWHIDARFGHKQALIDSMKEWHRTIGAQIGWSADKVRLLTGSVGARESTVVAEMTLKDIAELDASWTKLATIPEHKEWSRRLEPDMVSGSTRWEILRIVE